jgi:hypothetical protein
MPIYGKVDEFKQVKRDIVKEGRYIGGGHDKSAPTAIPCILLKVINLVDECKRSKSFRFKIPALLFTFFLFIIKNTAHIALILRAICKPNHCLLAYTSYIWYA